MTAEKFRSLALSLPDTVEGSHCGHPDFRVAGRIFASLGPADSGWSMVKLTPLQQAQYTETYPAVFAAFDNAWGRQGCTRILLKVAKVTVTMEALKDAWQNTLNKHKPARND